MVLKDKTSNIYLSGEHILVTSFIKKEEPRKLKIGKKYVLISKSKGKGFSGVIKRHNFSGGNKTHGNSKAHRKPGSIGMCQDPGRVFKGKKMAGHMGNKKNTKKNFLIYFSKKKMIFIGNVSGSRKSEIKIKDDFKHYKKK
ncbi:LSU ribosomal protein L3p (L3e) [Candidatus Vidania fulgoroideae]|nr:LSU ribosomal protein L3p (L3e) [Candidatus Vidania fulgoroideae]